MRQKSIGEVLRVARENSGLSLVELQRLTKIQSKYLQALEYNDFESIPDSAYARSFLKRYAEVLELDASVLLDAYEQNRLVVFDDDGLEEIPERSRSKKQKRKPSSYMPLIYLLISAGLIVVFVGWITYHRLQHQASIPKDETAYTVISSSTTTSPEETTTSAPQQSTAEPKTNLQITGGGQALAVTVAASQKPVEIQLSVTDVTSWISLSDTDIANGVVLSPDNKTVTVTIPEGVTTTTLTLGVVQGVRIQVAGEEVATSALTNQTGTITFTIE